MLTSGNLMLVKVKTKFVHFSKLMLNVANFSKFLQNLNGKLGDKCKLSLLVLFTETTSTVVEYNTITLTNH